MSTLTPISGSSFYSIKTEGQEISIKIEKTSPTTARISWTLPHEKCEGDPQYYNGIIITIDTSPINRLKEPKDGISYISDPTANITLHSGDKLDSALIVGAFYNDITTTYLDITDLQENIPYYVSGFAVSKEYFYHTAGVHSYSVPYGTSLIDPDLSGYKIIKIGIDETDSTGLAALTNYSFKLSIDLAEPVTLNINGSNSSIYSDLVNEINKQISLLNNPLQSNTNPNTNAYYFDNVLKKLYQWDGNEHIQLEVIVESTDPSLPNLNDYWYDIDNNSLYKWNGVSWILQNLIKYSQDPTILDCDDYWFNGTSAYKWDGYVWCEKNLYNQIINPSFPPIITCPTYWYDSLNEFLYSWDDIKIEWKSENPVLYPTDPTLLTNGSYWFDLSSNNIKILSLLTVWTTVTNTFIQIEEPTNAANNSLWFNLETEVLSQYNQSLDVWNPIPVIVWDKNPLTPETCDIWWDTTSNNLKIWDIITNSWVIATNFIQSTIDPSLPPTLTENDVWYNSTLNKLYRWDGSEFIEVTFINNITNPKLPSINDVWYNTTTTEYFVWSPSWVLINPTLSNDDPYIPTAGDYWFNTTLNTLNQHNGISWINILYSLIPYTPTIGSKYFNTTTNLLMEWNGTDWVIAKLLANATIDDNGDLKITSTKLGSSSYITIEDINLFSSLIPTATLQTSVIGVDGIPKVPMYKEINVGDDGSEVERREIMEYIRSELGYPFVEVELTKTHLNNAINLAIEILRQRSASAEQKQYFFITLSPGTQVYKLTDSRVGLNKIVNVISIHRTRAAITGNGDPWDQFLVQHLLNASGSTGAFDLTSFHLLNEYIETTEQLFATSITFQWRERSRELILNKRIGKKERVILESTIERTEQDLMTDRYTRPWIKKWALAESKEVLSQIRGKFATLPGSGGGVSLNAGDLANEAASMKQELLEEIENFIVSDKLDTGLYGDFLIG